MNSRIVKTKCVFVLACLFGMMPGYSQKFDWCEDGFSPFTQHYSNIDNSGIDLEISGIYQNRACMYNEPYIFSGINSGGESGFVHNYNFTFSETVDVEFNIYDINADTIGNFRYNDFLVFSPSPIFSKYSPSLTIKGDTILPDYKNPNAPGEVKVKYKNINSFSIQHGLGKGANPGNLIFYSLIINDDKLSAPKMFNQVADKELAVFKQNSGVRYAHLIATTGQILKPKFQTDEYSVTRIETLKIAAGIYVAIIEFETGHILKERIMISH